jgi:hypothetical protein
MRFNRLAVFLSLAALAVGIALAGCKSSSTSGSGSSDGGKTGDSSSGFSGGDFEMARAKRVSINNLRQIGLALHNFHDAMGMLPSAGVPGTAKASNPGEAMKAHSWRVSILPYIEQGNLYNLIMTNPMAPLPESVTKTEIKQYQIPGTKAKGTLTCYRAFVGGGAAFDYGAGHRMTEITDGTSNTILVVEAAEPVEWSSVNELNYDPKKPLPKLGVFPGGFHALMGDGSIRWIPSDTPEATLRNMITRAGGELVDLPGKDVTRGN